jgi:hypothetical protein
MCDEIKITKVADDKIEVRTPYNPQFVSKIKTAGARWNAIDKAWTMHAANIDVAREILRAVYGRDDMPAADEKLVRVRVTALQNISADRGPIVLLGRIIASARGRDSGARVGEGVAFIDGKPQSGGSVKNWTTEISEGSIFVVADVPTTLLGELDETGWRGQKLYRYEIIDDDRDEQLRKLQARREELAAALADIDAQINALKGGN